MLIPIGEKTISNLVDSNIKGEILGHHPLFYLWIMFFAESFSIISYFLLSFRKKVQKKRKIVRLSWIKFLLYSLVLSVMDFCTTLFHNFYQVGGGSALINNLYKILYLLVTIFLTMKFLKYKYYKHNFVGLSILILGIIIHMLFNFFMDKKEEKEEENYTIIVIINFAFILVSSTITAFQEVGEKYLMDKRYIDPLLLLSFEGFFGTILLGLSFIFLGKIDYPTVKGIYGQFPFRLCEKESDMDTNIHIEDFVKCLEFLFSHFEYLISYILLFLGLFLYNHLKMLTIHYFSPIHTSMGNVLKLFLFWIFQLCIPFYKPNTGLGYNIGVFLFHFCL